MFEFVKFRAIEDTLTAMSIVVLGTVVGRVTAGPDGTKIVEMLGCKPSEPMSQEVWEAKATELDEVARARVQSYAAEKQTREWADRPCDGCPDSPGQKLSSQPNAVTGLKWVVGPCYRCRDGAAHGKPGTQTPVDQRNNYGYDNFGPKAEAVKAAVAAHGATL